MFQHILVTVAFDQDHDPSRALATARSILGPKGRITVMHVMPSVPSFAIRYMPEGYDAELRDTVRGELDRLAESVPGGEGVLHDGDAATEILAYAAGHGVDCIVISSHRPGMRDFLLGSTASRVVRHAHCSVMVLR